MKNKAHKAKSGSSDPASGAPTEESRSAGACDARRSRAPAGARGEPGCRVAGEARCRPTSSSSRHRVFVEQGRARAADQGGAGGAGAALARAKSWRADDAPGAGRGSHRKRGLHGQVEEARDESASSPRRGSPLPLDHDLRDVSTGAVVGVHGGLGGAAGAEGRAGAETAISDAELLTEIRAVLAACPFHGEGYRKVRARLAHRGYAASGERVLRLMRPHSLLAPRRLGPPNGDPAHDGTITTERPDVMWRTDGTRFYTEQDGWCWFFGAIRSPSR